MKKVTIAVFAALALALAGAAPAQADLSDEVLGTEANETQPEATEDAPAEESPAAETKDAADCAAYANADAWCEPDVDDYDCDQIDEAHKPVHVVDPSNDPFLLDDDNDGEGCEVSSGGDAGGGGDEGGTPDEPDEAVGDCAHYADSAAWCVDGVEDYDCPDIDDAHKPIELFDAEKDPFHLDRDVDALGCEIGEDDDGGSAGDDGGGDGGSDDGGATGGEQLPNTGSPSLGLLWFAAIAFVASGALLMRRRANTVR
ncbi:LPXTG cell wall anchor domain-containing protein [Jiangella asiatica]|uniref:LPXTG cell wall anchor domain-containing protein n=1 Tax=Jiangella asiatica TaxID=2530372 RepID=A0A4R5DHZ1_9ACTN|nr:LPXTG cell wall anchor domain-containing protein [Jiangella asiatica]TDE13499.1 LPXTG cell wall anchor domain-containing protein [Jiangella asiatica]